MRKNETVESRAFDNNFLRVLTPIMILHLLTVKPMYIYQISAELSKKSGGRFEALPLYPVMNRLLNEGYVEETGQKIVDNRVRNFYGITPAGKNYLKELLAQLDGTLALLKIILKDHELEEHHGEE